MQASSRYQGWEYASISEISSDGRNGREMKAIISRCFLQLELLANEVSIVDKILMRDGNAFGCSGRPRRVDDITEVLREGSRHRVGLRLALQSGLIGV